MSKIGKTPIDIADGVTVSQEGQKIVITGPKGNLSCPLPGEIKVKIENQKILIERKSDDRFVRALHGTIRALLANMVKGVTEGFEKVLVLQGVGYRAKVEGDSLILSVGFSHPVLFKAPAGINFLVIEDKITISGIDKQMVGEVADKIRKIKPPEPYKGKGIKYIDEIIRRKAGKKAVATA